MGKSNECRQEGRVKEIHVVVVVAVDDDGELIGSNILKDEDLYSIGEGNVWDLETQMWRPVTADEWELATDAVRRMGYGEEQ